jgi:hypothetical protein
MAWTLQNLSRVAKHDRIKTAQAAGTADITSDSVDMTGFHGCMFLVAFGAIVASAVTSVKIQTSSDDSNWNDLAGSSVTVADTDDNTCALIDVAAPLEQYLRVYVDRGTANSTVDSIHAFQYGAHSEPVTHADLVAAGAELHESPAEGTA